MLNRILKTLDALLGISAATAAIALIYEALRLCSTEGQAYTYPKIAAAFSEIALPVCGFAVFAAVMLLVRMFVPRREQHSKPARPAPSRKESPAAVRISAFVLAAAFIILGILNGGLRDVLAKAVNICTECIGLG